MQSRNLRSGSHFPAEALSFLNQLKRHNNRLWFQSHKEEYERTLKEPMRELVLEIGEAFGRFAPEMVADPSRSIYRIYRDTRFSQDKSPYKTHIAAVFPVRGLPKNSGPGLYFRLSEAEVLMGGGIYMPNAPLLRAVREQIAANPRKFVRLAEGKAFRDTFGDLQGEQLRTIPKGFAANHSASKYLRYKQFLFRQKHAAKLACSPRLLPALLNCFEKAMPMIRFLAAPARSAASLVGSLEGAQPKPLPL